MSPFLNARDSLYAQVLYETDKFSLKTLEIPETLEYVCVKIIHLKPHAVFKSVWGCTLYE